MKIQFWSIGKNHEAYVKEGIDDFTKRISKYFPVEWTIIPMPKNAGMMSEMDLKKKEGEMVLDWLKKDDYLVALDEMILKRANYKWSLSQLTFPHQLVRVILAEQVYRACTIIRNEKYHH